MNYETLLDVISRFGYAALFFALWLGIVGMPIPDEVVVMTGGAVSRTGVLLPAPAFAVTYLGVVTGLSLGYVLGRYLGSPVLDRLRRKKAMDKHLRTAERMVSRYGNYALVFSYFLPVVRHVVPYLVGINRMPFRRYVLYSYTTGFVWTLAFFLLGQWAGTHVQAVGTLIYRYGLYAGMPVTLLVLMILLLRSRVKRRVEG